MVYLSGHILCVQEKMCILHLLDVLFYECHVKVIQIFYVLTDFYLPFLLITERAVLESPTMIVDLSISLFIYSNFCSMYL